MTPFDIPMAVVLVWLFLLGATLGSFLNVCIYRIPEHERFWDQLKGLWGPPSSCPRCRNRIPLTDNVPILGWLKLRGRCRFCRGWISPRYPLVELLNGLLLVLVYWIEVPGDFRVSFHETWLYSPIGPQGIPGSAWLSPTAVLNWRAVYHMVLIESLVVATFIDFDHKIIPDGATLPAMAVGFLGAAVLGQVHLVPVWFQDPYLLGTLKEVFSQAVHPWLSGPEVPVWIAESPHWHGLIHSLAGFAVGGGSIWAVRILAAWVLKREAMGFGDVILMATIGSFLGWQPTLVVFFLAPIAAMVVAIGTWFIHRETEIPYGPYLSLAALAVLLGWPWIWPRFERVFSLGPLLIPVAVIMGVLLVLSLHGMQLAKRLLGIPLYSDAWYGEWTSADQLTHFAGETVDRHQGRWRPAGGSEWPGTAAGRGLLHSERWRRGK